MKDTEFLMNAPLRRITFIPLILFGLLSIIATGGGGGGGDGDGGGTTSKQVITGSVNETTATTAVASKTVASEDAIVEIISYNNNDEEIDAATAPVATGFFSVQLDLANAGGYLLLKVEKDGYTDFSKRIDYDDPADVNIAAELRPLDIVVATPGTALKSNGESMRAFSFAVVRYPDGTRKAIAGSDQVRAAKAATTSTELEIQIPTDSVDANTLMGRFSNFDPSNPDDEGNFPGNYKDSEGNTLLSVAFDYVNITDENGTNISDLIPAGTAGAAKAADASTTVYRWIPSGSCGSLNVGDTDDTQPGFQVPVYTLNPHTHLWILLGRGVVVVPDGGGGWTQLDAGSVTPSDCDTTGYYLEILVSNAEFLHYWWNLDYPLVFAEPTQFCVIKTLQDDAQNKLAGWSVGLTDNNDADGNSYDRASGYTDRNGQVQLTVTELDSTNPDIDSQGTLRIWNRFANIYQTETVPLGEYPNCATDTNTITNPLKCTVQGRLVDDESGNSRPGVAVRVYSPDSGHSGAAVSDSNGEFSVKVICQDDYTLGVGGDWTTQFNVNQTTSDHSSYESSDNGNTVVLNNVEVANLKPYVTGKLDSYVIYGAGSTKVHIYGKDYDGDYPLSYVLKDESGAINMSGQDAITEDSPWVTETLSGLTEGTTYSLSVTVTDSLGASSTRGIGDLVVCGTNNCDPIIRWAFPDRYEGHNGDTINLYSSAYDLDGDYPLTYSWRVDGTEVAATQNASYSIPMGASHGQQYQIELVVSDAAAGTAGKAFTISAINRAPYITSVTVGSAQMAGGDTLYVQAGDALAMAVQATDPEGDPLTYSWSVDSTEISTTTTANFDIPTGAADGSSYDVQITVSDDKGGSSSVNFTLTVASGVDTTVIIQ